VVVQTQALAEPMLAPEARRRAAVEPIQAPVAAKQGVATAVKPERERRAPL
jgi:hypothetical protein